MPPKADPYATPLHRRIDTFLVWSLLRWSSSSLLTDALTRFGASYALSVLGYLGIVDKAGAAGRNARPTMLAPHFPSEGQASSGL
jgi:hypothetical protein